MRAIMIEAKDLESAHDLYSAFSGFYAELSGSDAAGYRVSIEIGGANRQLANILDALQRYVASRNDGPAELELDGKHYTMHWQRY